MLYQLCKLDTCFNSSANRLNICGGIPCDRTGASHPGTYRRWCILSRRSILRLFSSRPCSSGLKNWIADLASCGDDGVWGRIQFWVLSLQTACHRAVFWHYLLRCMLRADSLTKDRHNTHKHICLRCAFSLIGAIQSDQRLPWASPRPSKLVSP